MDGGVPRGRLVVGRSLVEHDGLLLSRRLIGGLPLISRQVLTLGQAGITDIEIAVDADLHGAVSRAIARAPRIDARRLRLVNADAPVHVEGAGTVVLAADLVIDPRALRQLVVAAAGAQGSIVAVDRFNANYAPADKSPFTGGAPGGFDGRIVTAEDVAREGLSPIGLSSQRAAPTADPRTIYLDIGRYGWHRVLAASDAAVATTKVLLSTIKPTDGIFARANRRVSMAISRVILPTPITPNQVTIVTLLASLFAGVVMSGGTYVAFVVGGFLAWFASMLDGVDGEVARAKFQFSKLGHWLEMTCDYAFYLAVMYGYGVGFYTSSGDPMWQRLGIVGAVGVVLSFVVVARNKREYSAREPDGDYYIAFQRTVGAQTTNPLYRFSRLVGFLVLRSAFPYFITIFAVLGLSKLMFGMVLVGAHLSWLLPAYAARLKLSVKTVAAAEATPSDQPAQSSLTVIHEP